MRLLLLQPGAAAVVVVTIALLQLFTGVSGFTTKSAGIIISCSRNGQQQQQYQQHQQQLRTTISTTTTQLHAKSRKARRQVTKSRPKSFYDAIEDAQGFKPKTNDDDNKNNNSSSTTIVTDEAILLAGAAASSSKDNNNNNAVDQDEANRQAKAAEAQARMEQRPEVSTMIIDEETGTEIVAQGKNVLDVVTRRAVQLYGGSNNQKITDEIAAFRLAQMFPGVPLNIREKYRFQDFANMQVPQIVDALQQACLVKGQIPTHPSIANKAIDFVTANRDYLGSRMKHTLGRLTMRSAWLANNGAVNANNNNNNNEPHKQVQDYQQLWKHFMTIENYVSAPFRQIMLDAEGRVGTQFGNLDLKSYANGHLYERCGNYLVLKGMVAHWEKKVLDAEYVERTPQTPENYITVLSRGDPKRYLPDPPILYTLRECAQVANMAQQMCKIFVDTPELFDDLPVEVRFIEKALTIKGGTLLRQYMVQDYCPAEKITPTALIEGLRRLIAQLDNMQIDPYADIVNILERLQRAMAVGGDNGDDYNPYQEYLANTDRNGPGYFQTYTFDHEKLSRVRFLDGSYDNADAGVTKPPREAGSGGLGALFGFGGGGNSKPEPVPKARNENDSGGETYKVPDARAIGRPHNLGWLDLINQNNSITIDNDDSDASPEGLSPDISMKFGQVQPGRIIPDDES